MKKRTIAVISLAIVSTMLLCSCDSKEDNMFAYLVDMNETNGANEAADETDTLDASGGVQPELDYSGIFEGSKVKAEMSKSGDKYNVKLTEDEETVNLSCTLEENRLTDVVYKDALVYYYEFDFSADGATADYSKKVINDYSENSENPGAIVEERNESLTRKS